MRKSFLDKRRKNQCFLMSCLRSCITWVAPEVIDYSGDEVRETKFRSIVSTRRRLNHTIQKLRKTDDQSKGQNFKTATDCFAPTPPPSDVFLVFFKKKVSCKKKPQKVIQPTLPIRKCLNVMIKISKCNNKNATIKVSKYRRSF